MIIGIITAIIIIIIIIILIYLMSNTMQIANKFLNKKKVACLLFWLKNST